MGNLALRQRLMAHHAAGSSGHAPIELLDVTGNTTKLDYIVVDRLSIASLRVTNLPIAFADAHMFRVLGLQRTPALLLGMDVLRAFGRVSIDFGSKKVRFQLKDADVTAPSRRPAQGPAAR